MCGLAGVFGPAGAPLEALPDMASALAHRGPDDQGFAVVAGRDQPRVGRDLPELMPERRGATEIGLAHLRLTIIDLSDDSAQPMTSGDGRLILAFNGEIYNYRELRSELEALGQKFRTSGDTEVLLNAYRAWGPDCVDRLIGMWAFALVDLDERIVLLSRDRFGIKPLLWAPLPNNGIAFASEMKALRAVPGVRFEPNASVIRRFLLTGIVDEGDETFVDGVRRLLPAENMIVPFDEGVRGIRRHRYWSLPAEPGASRPDAPEAVRELLTDAVRIHLRSDAPLGTCLSGGIDSSGIVGLCEQLRTRGDIANYTHHAFGYVPPSGRYSEERFMRIAAEHSHVHLTTVRPSSEEFQDALLDVVRAQDEPFGSLSIAAQWFVFRSAHRAGMKVMLDGQGADEIFGGYHHFLGAVAIRLLKQHRIRAYLRYAADHRRLYGRPPFGLLELARMTRFGRLIPSRPGGNDDAPAPASLFRGELATAQTYGEAEADDLHDVLVQQTARISLPALLRFEDRNSMAHSVEGRVPFLDHRLVELAFSLPPETKIAGAQPKDVLRKALADVLPPEILARRDKIGFRADTTATREFVSAHRGALAESRTDWEREWLDPDAVNRALASTGDSDIDEFNLWRLANLKLWFRMNWDAERHPLEGEGDADELWARQGSGAEH